MFQLFRISAVQGGQELGETKGQTPFAIGACSLFQL